MWPANSQSARAQSPKIAREDGRLRHLLKQLRASLPDDAHEQRLRRALDGLSESPHDGAALTTLLEGAVSCASTPLQRELLARMRGVAPPPLGLLSLLQPPVLRRLPLALALISSRLT